MIRKSDGEFQWLEFELLAEQPRLTHGVILRKAGAHALPSGSAKDTHRCFFERRQIHDVVCGRQVHGDEVVLVKDVAQEVGDCDALITERFDLTLMTRHADCQAAIFYDPIRHALASVHAGWRGNVKNIYRSTVQRMQQEFGSKPENLLVGISPSLGPNHAEFKHYQLEFPKEFWDFQVRPNYFDLWAIARHQLEQCGILSDHLQIAEVCTYANPKDCFSYRRDKVKSGHVTFALLR